MVPWGYEAISNQFAPTFFTGYKPLMVQGTVACASFY